VTTTPPDVRHEDLITASRVKGTAVFNLDGDRIGHVEELSIERESGQVRYALMSFGGFLGIGDKLHPIPWRLLKYNTTHIGYVIPLNRKELEDAPNYTAEELAAYGGHDMDYREGVYAYYGRYGIAPYW
jgi:sporulation protein YlmC with PRC-barrel domain